MTWKFLSYELSNELSGYGNGQRIEVKDERSMCCGDTSNNTSIQTPTHFGTHLDFPYHFSSDGKKSSHYSCADFVFDKVMLKEVQLDSTTPLISPVNCELNFCELTEVLLLKTGYCYKRDSDVYWENGPGFDPSFADYLKKQIPNIKMIGFDSISLTNFQNRPLGRIAHKKFLIDNDILILEDMDLRNIEVGKDNIKLLIASPLRVKECDGALTTVLAEIQSNG